MVKKYCEFKTHVNGAFTIYYDGNLKEYKFVIMAGFMKGEFIIAKDELMKLKTFLKKIEEARI